MSGFSGSSEKALNRVIRWPGSAFAQAGPMDTVCGPSRAAPPLKRGVSARVG